MSYKPRGVITAIFTPFGANGELDEDTLERHISSQIKSGIHGILVIGSSGEYVNLSDEERKRVIAVSVDVTKGRVPVIAGVLSPSTWYALELVNYAKEAGAQAVLVLTPYFNKPSIDGVYEHFETIAKETDFPMIVYNNPARTGINLDSAMIDKLAQIDNIIGLKECDRDLGRVAEKIKIAADRLSVLSGEDDLAFLTFMLGSKGAILAVPNLVPQMYIELYQAVEDGDIQRAREINYKLLPLVNAVYTQNHPGPLKEAMAMIGCPVGSARQPLHSMTSEEEKKLRDVLADLHLIR